MNKIEQIIKEFNHKNYENCLILIQEISFTKYSIFDRDAIEFIKILNQFRSKTINDEGILILSKLINILKHIKMYKKAFIVHGWDNELKLETKNYFQNSLSIECTILHEQDGAGDVIINKFEKFASDTTFAIILLSDNDSFGEKFEDPDALKRPRPNVLFEMGYFFAKFGRNRVIILKKGNVEIHSDIYGIEYIDVSNGVESAGEKIRKRIVSIFK